MTTINLPLHEGLYGGTRLRGLASSGQQTRTVELGFLVLCGITAAVASQWLDFRLRVGWPESFFQGGSSKPLLWWVFGRVPAASHKEKS
jgi:hypothetical protein